MTRARARTRRDPVSVPPLHPNLTLANSPRAPLAARAPRRTTCPARTADAVLRRSRELLFVSERALVGAGHDFVPLVFAPGPGGAWELADELDKKPAKEKEAAGGDGGGVAAARAMWQTKAKTGESKSKEDDSSWKKHQSPITFMQVRRARARGGGAVRRGCDQSTRRGASGSESCGRRPRAARAVPPVLLAR